MSNEKYLIISYFVVCGMALIVAFSAYLWLRPAVQGISQKLSAKQLARIIRKLFPLSLLFPVLLGFFSITYKNCEKDTYEKVIADRSYLVTKNQEQLSATFRNASVGIFVFGLLVFIVLIADDNQHRKKSNS